MNVVSYSYERSDYDKYGYLAAVLLYNFRYRILSNRKENFIYTFKDGFFWTYDTYEDYVDQYHGQFTYREIEWAIKKLLKAKELITSQELGKNYNKRRYDRTRWYTIPHMHQVNLSGNKNIQRILEDLQMPISSDLNTRQARSHTIVPDFTEIVPGFTEIVPGFTEIVPPIQYISTLDKSCYESDMCMALKNQEELLEKEAKEADVIDQDVFDAFKKYEALGLRAHKLTSRNIKLVSGKLKKLRPDYSLEDILSAMENYQKAISSGVINYVWDLWDFLGHIKAEKYYPENFNPENYVNKRDNSKQQLSHNSNAELANKLGLIK